MAKPKKGQPDKGENRQPPKHKDTRSAGRGGRRPKQPEPEPIHTLPIRADAPLKEIYAKVKAAFTAADLAKFADLDEETIPAEQVVAQLEAEQEADERRQRRKKA
jgi:hypothetical protein